MGTERRMAVARNTEKKQGANVGLQNTEYWRPRVQMAAQQWEGTEKQ